MIKEQKKNRERLHDKLLLEMCGIIFRLPIHIHPRKNNNIQVQN